MKNWLNIGCLGLLMGWMVACTQEQVPDLSQGKASLTLKVATSAASRAVAPGDGDLYKGGGMEDLTVVLVNSSNEIVAKQQVTGLTGDERRTKVVTIDEGLDVGNYTLYAFANTENALLGEAKTLLNNLNVGNTWNQTDALFNALAGTAVPTMDNAHPLLLTASKTVSLGINDNHTTIDLLRPIVWFQVKLYNHSEKDMTVNSLSFSNFNPSTGYLLPHDGDVPSSVSYRSLPAYGGDVTVEAGTNEVVYDIALFENVADSYTMNMTLRSNGKNVSLNAAKLMTINSETAAVEPMTRQIRNQHITVTVNAYYNEKEGTFNFKVEPWKKKEAGVTFN